MSWLTRVGNGGKQQGGSIGRGLHHGTGEFGNHPPLTLGFSGPRVEG